MKIVCFLAGESVHDEEAQNAVVEASLVATARLFSSHTIIT